MAERSSPNIAMVSLMAGLAGAGIALLFAPRSGKETRAGIKRRSAELKDQAEDNLHHAVDSINTGIDKTRDSLTEALNKTSRKAKGKYEEFQEDTERTGNKQSPVLRAWEEEV
jgi:gas vesicle protein